MTKSAENDTSLLLYLSSPLKRALKICAAEAETDVSKFLRTIAEADPRVRAKLDPPVPAGRRMPRQKPPA
jgi:hypothetical protein